MSTNTLTLRQRLRGSLAKAADKLPSFRGKIRCLRVLDGFLREIDLPDIKNIGGVNFSLQTTDLIDFRLFYLGGNEANVRLWLEHRIQDMECVLWDVGSNVGSISLPLLHACPHLVAYCFEPSPANLLRLRKNVQLNAPFQDRVFVVPRALGNQSGEAEFFPSAQPQNSGIGSLLKMKDTVDFPVRIIASTGDEIIEAGVAQPPHFIKIDVEGFEYEVVQGLQKYLLKSNNVTLVFEHSVPKLRERGVDQDAVFQLLHSLGYKTHVLRGENSHENGVQDHVAFKAQI